MDAVSFAAPSRVRWKNLQLRESRQLRLLKKFLCGGSAVLCGKKRCSAVPCRAVQRKRFHAAGSTCDKNLNAAICSAVANSQNFSNHFRISAPSLALHKGCRSCFYTSLQIFQGGWCICIRLFRPFPCKIHALLRFQHMRRKFSRRK